MEKFPIGTAVTFKAGPRSTSLTNATVTGHTPDGKFLITKDAAGVERKTRPGNVRV